MRKNIINCSFWYYRPTYQDSARRSKNWQWLNSNCFHKHEAIDWQLEGCCVFGSWGKHWFWMLRKVNTYRMFMFSPHQISNEIRKISSDLIHLLQKVEKRWLGTWRMYSSRRTDYRRKSMLITISDLLKFWPETQNPWWFVQKCFNKKKSAEWKFGGKNPGYSFEENCRVKTDQIISFGIIKRMIALDQFRKKIIVGPPRRGKYI